MSENRFEMLDRLREAIVMVKDGRICYANEKALKLLGKYAMNSSAEKYFPEVLLTGEGAAEANIGGTNCGAVSTVCGEYIQIVLSPESSGDMLLTPSLLASMRSSLMSIGLLTQRMRKKCEEDGDEETKFISRSLSGTYLKMRRNIGNMEVISGAYEPVFTITDVAEHLDNLMGTVELLCPAVKFTVSYKENCLAELDRELFDRLILNLISNCISHNSSCNAVSVTMGSTSSHIFISVRDNGTGIESDKLPEIFDKYLSEDISSQLTPGAGYGMSAVRKIANMHGGTVFIDSKDSGTAVMVSLKKADTGKLKELTTDTMSSMELILTGLSDCLESKYFTEKYMD